MLLRTLIAAGSIGLGVSCFAGAAAAQERACSYLRVHIELGSAPDWQVQVPALQARLRELQNVDPCAQVTIRAQADGVLVSVTSGDRSASRLLKDPRELVRTVEALVVLPPRVTPPERLSPEELPPREPSPARPTTESAPRMELGGGAAGRAGGNPLMLGGGVATFAQLTDRDWLIGVTARWEFADGFAAVPPPSGFNMQSGAVGLMFGRRIDSSAVACDFLVGPTMVLESEEAFGSSPGNADGIEGSTLDARLDATVRASVPATSRVRFYAAGDIEVSPRRALRAKRLDATLPALPAWTSGVAVGVMWGTR